MSSPQPQSDTAILQMLLPNLEEEGFRVFPASLAFDAAALHAGISTGRNRNEGG